MPAYDLEIRQRAVAYWANGKRTFGQVAAHLGVNYHTVRQWIKRYEQNGPEGLRLRYDRCGRRPRVSDLIKRAALWLKRLHPLWGAPFIRIVLKDRYPGAYVPGPRQLQVWFKRYQLQPTKTRLPKARKWAKAPLEVIQLDAKERLQTKDGQPCNWLTFTDEHTGATLQGSTFPPQPDQPGSSGSD